MKKKKGKTMPTKTDKKTTTIYLPKEADRDFFIEAMETRAKEVMRPRGSQGVISPYIIGLVKQDLKKKGLYDAQGKPQEEKLKKLQKEISERNPYDI